MSDKVKPRQQRTPKKHEPQVQTHKPVRSRREILPFPDEETENGFNVGHNLNEEWR